ncbi:MAG: DUF2169 domain-containing protein [Byssovorax sp.]
MDVVSPGPFRVASLLFQPRPHAYAMAVICRATFHLAPTTAELADDQDPPAEEDNYWNDDPSRSLYAPSDLIPFKPRPEVILVGNAFAPRKEPVRKLTVRLIVGEVDKSIEVFGDRSFSLEGTLRDGARFVKMPLRYERAAGGPETDNPVGVRLDARDAQGLTQIPNLQPPGLFITQLGEHIPAIGFGPIAPSWPSRREKLGRHAGAFPPARLQGWAERPLPADIDTAYFNTAPRDQLLEAIRDNERIILENLHPEHPRLITSLPDLRPRATLERSGAPPEEVQLSADTLWIDTDRCLCAVVWRGQIRLSRPDEAGQVLVMADNRRRSIPDLSWSSSSSASSADDRPIEGNKTMGLERKAGKVLPFVEASHAESPLGRSSTAWAPHEGEVGSTTMSLDGDLDAIEAQAEGPEETQSLGNEAMSALLSDVHGRPPMASSLPFVPPPTPSAPTFGPPPAPRAQPPQPPQPPPLPPPRPSVPSRPAPVIPPPVPSAPTFGPAPAPAPQISPRFSTDAARAPNVAQSGLLAASNAAAAEPAPVEDAAPSPSPPPVSEARPPAPKSPPRELLQLLWFDPKSPPVIRKQRAFRPIIAALEEEQEREEEDDEDDELPAEGSPEHWDHRSVLGVLVRGAPLDTAGIREAMASAVRPDGSYQPPLVLCAGELSFPFDELSMLRAMVTAMSPLAAADKKLKEAIDSVQDLLKAPWPEGSGKIADGLAERLREAFGQTKRMIPADYLEQHTERMVLGERRYQKRSLLGDTWIRSLFRPGNTGDPIPTYLPEKLSRDLPMFPRFGARLIAEVTMQQDPYENTPLALRVVALGRTLAVPRG